MERIALFSFSIDKFKSENGGSVKPQCVCAEAKLYTSESTISFLFFRISRRNKFSV